MSSKRIPNIVLIGRVNAGKSTLFNACAQTRDALTSSIPGTTRDYKERTCHWQGVSFNLIDTGGFEFRSHDNLHEDIRQKTLVALNNADFILFVVDGQKDMHPLDKDIAAFLQKHDAPTLLVINKIDSQKQESEIAPDLYKLPFKDVFIVSSIKGRGIGDLLDALTSRMPKRVERMDMGLRLAFLGKPNVGKSSLINAIVREPRVIVNAKPHTTRDTQHIRFMWRKKPLTLVDTAGLTQRKKLRKNSHLERGGALERIAMAQAERTLQEIDVAMFVVDASVHPATLDMRIARSIADAAKPVLIIANKWDKVAPKDSTTLKKREKELRGHLPNLHEAPMIFTSAVTGTRVQKILNTATDLHTRAHVRLPQTELDALADRLSASKELKAKRGFKPPILQSIMQGETNPPFFIVRVKSKTPMQARMIKMIAKRLAELADFRGIPVRLDIRYT